jgi:hypothetical protein
LRRVTTSGVATSKQHIGFLQGRVYRLVKTGRHINHYVIKCIFKHFKIKLTCSALTNSVICGSALAASSLTPELDGYQVAFHQILVQDSHLINHIEMVNWE